MTGDEVRRSKFGLRWRGYAPADVDAALDRLATRIDRGHRLDVDELTRLQFGSSFRGYSPQQVDALLNRLRLENA